MFIIWTLQGQGQWNQSALAGLLQQDRVNNKCQFQAVSLKVLISNINHLYTAAPFQRMNYQHVMECRGSLPFTARHWPRSWARWIHSIFVSLSIQNTQHQPTFTLFWGQVQLVNPIMHCPLLYMVKAYKMEHIFRDYGAGLLLVIQRQPTCGETQRRALLMQSHLRIHGKKSVSNQRSLAQWPRIGFGYSAVHSGSQENGGATITALNLSTIKSYYYCVILLYYTSEFQLIILMTLCNFIEQLHNYT
jgi:hypothetical protein